MLKQNKYVRYDSVLPKEKIIEYSLIVDKFNEGEIDYKALVKMFNEKGIVVKPNLRDYQKEALLASQVEEFKQRRITGSYEPYDIKSFILNSKDFKDVVFVIDFAAMKVLAHAGIQKYQEQVVRVLRAQIRLTYNNDEQSISRRLEMEREIEELSKGLPEEPLRLA